MSDSRVTDSTASAAGAPAKPLKVLIGCDVFPPDVNGAARFAEQLASGLIDRGHEVHIAAPSTSFWKTGAFRETHLGHEMTVHRFRSVRWYPHEWLRFALPWRSVANGGKVIDAIKPDVVHFQSHIVVGRGLSIAGKRRGVRMVGTNHVMAENMMEFSMVPKPLHATAIRYVWSTAARIFGRCDEVTAPTRRAADFFERETGLRNVHAISCGIDAHLYTPDFTPRTENRIVFVGRITGEKQIDVLIKALALMPQELNATVEVVGSGELTKSLEHLADELGVRDRVVFTGYVENEQLREALTRASVFAMPSIAELQSIATMEAMATALPVVAADAMALPHLISEGENGYLFEPSNAQDLADRLTDVLTASPDDYERMKRASLRIVAAHDVQTTVTTFEKLYRGEVVVDPDRQTDDEQAQLAEETAAALAKVDEHAAAMARAEKRPNGAIAGDVVAE